MHDSRTTKYFHEIVTFASPSAVLKPPTPKKLANDTNRIKHKSDEKPFLLMDFVTVPQFKIIGRS